MESKRAAMEELAMKESRRQKEREDREREKQEFNQKIQYRNSIETQKEATYKQYYDQFRTGQETLQGVYQNKTAPQNQEKEKAMKEFFRK